jgi:hypothetical protein
VDTAVEVAANWKYKDSLFISLFKDPKRRLELYNALTGANYGPDTPIIDETLEQVFFLGRYDDLAFRLGDKIIFLGEQQSTINLVRFFERTNTAHGTQPHTPPHIQQI